MSKPWYFYDGKEDPYGLLPLQNVLTEIIDYIDSLCKEHNIKYFLMGGSALGALRHGGFIPWDDDLDIFMLHEDYNRFVALCRTELDTNRFYFQEEGTREQPHYFCKIRRNGTTYLEAERMGEGIHQGIFIDIMCLHNAPESVWKRKIQYYAAGLLKARACTKTAYQTDSKTKKIQLLIARIIVNGFIKKLLLRMVKKYDTKGTPLVAHLFGRAKFSASFYPAELFCKQRYVPFEKIELPVPNKAEEYLTLRFGPDFMKMPDDETRAAYKSHSCRWDVEKDYREVL